jgi:hypothetical protein
MRLTGRPSYLVCLAAFALNCGSVSTLSVDAATDKGAGQAGSSGGGSAGSGAGGGAGAAGSGHAGAAGGGAGGGGSGHAGAGGGTGGTGGAGGHGGSGGVCAVACTIGRTCCGGACANLNNDPMNCGACGTHCDGANNLCSGGTCVPSTCAANVRCAANTVCCGNNCCGAGSLCCENDGPISGGPPSCFTPTADQPTCPQGCAPLCVSDRDQKKNIQPVDTSVILEKVGRLPISAWTYRKEPEGVRHLGPMAQDFRATFGLGDDDRTYFAVDAQGVALAAIQALNQQVTAQAARIDKLERENRALARRLVKAGR